MNSKAARLKKRLYLCSLALLVAGLCAALMIYVYSAEDTSGVEGYVMANGVVHRLDLSHSKMYVHELRHFGGRAAVLFDDFNRWFAGLWRGKALAVSIASLSVLASLGIFLFARWLPSGAGMSPER